MGGDNSIEDIIGGVRQFCYENNNDNLLLHGNKTLIAKELDKYPELKNKCKIKHCDKVVHGRQALSIHQRREKLQHVEHDRKCEKIKSGGCNIMAIPAP